MKTKRAIRAALLGLLESKPMDALTVTELCAAAEVSKPAFYYHYKNVYEVLAEIEDEVIDEIIERVSRTDIAEFGTASFVRAFGRSVFESPLRSVLSTESMRRDFRSRLSSSLGTRLDPHWASGRTGRRALAVAFAFNGLLGAMDLIGEDRYFQAVPELAEMMGAALVTYA